jgi:XTP/dITP diphosphohydrolase
MPGQITVVVATRSVGKLRELVPLFAAADYRCITLEQAALAESPEEAALEAFDTFEANALAKARWFSARSGGRVVVADDSGLEVDALNGAPGVRSKRWSGREDLQDDALDAANNAILLRSLEQVPLADGEPRLARYVCAAACVWNGGELVVRGTCEGEIVAVPVGSGGFGYDPYFFSNELGRTFAQATREEKSLISHRGRAFARLIAAMTGALQRETSMDLTDPHG